MPFRRFFIILLLSFSVIMPAWGAKVSEMVPAPQVELMQPDPASIQREIEQLTRRIEYERPTDYQDVRRWIVNTGNNIGAMGDYVTASKSIKKRHEQRKKNAAEFAKLQDEIKIRGAKLPDVAVKDFERIFRQAAEEFGGILDDPQRSAKDVKKVFANVAGFLNHNELVIGDLRAAEPNLENGYVKMELLIKKLTDMVREGMVYAGPDYAKVWQPLQSRLIDAWTVRKSTGRDLVALESDLRKASADLEGCRLQVAAASAEAQRLLGAAAGGDGDKATDVGSIIDSLDKAWAQTELLPVFKRHSLRHVHFSNRCA